MSGSPSSSRRVLVILGVAAVSINGLTIGSRALAFASTRQPGSVSASAIPASAGQCPDVIFLGARGSGERLDTDKGLGPEVADMEAAVKKVLARHDISMNVAADPYSADSVDDLKPTKYEINLFKKDPVRAARYYYSHNVAKYIMSIKGGITNAVIQAEAAVSECPHVLLILAGYSQGAMVMHQAELKLAADHKTAVLKQIAATLLLGDGDRIKKTGAKEFGSSAATAEGVRTWLGQNSAKDVPKPTATANICDAKDIVCDFGISRVLDWKNSVAVHTSYAGKQVLTDAATWAAGLAVSAFQPISLNPGHLNALNAVSAVSPTDAWVAGAYCKSCSQFDVSDRTLIGHWDGRSWTRIASPNAGVSAFLLGISADSAADGWAVGFFCSPDCGFERPLILRWNGVAWSRSVIPASVQAGGGFLNSVTVVSPSDAWAVGDNGVGTLILRWNGTAWSQAPSPSPGSFPDLASVSADSAKDAWAVGSYCAANCTTSKPTYPTFTLHWNGAAWTQVTAPSPNLYNALTGVAAVSPKLAWAVGSTGTAANALLLRWSGTSWTKVSAPNVGSLAGISAKAATYAWALGSISPFLHWTAASGKWSVVDDADGDMQAVSSDAANDAWAVNYGGSTDGIEHWNGKTWSRSS